MNDYFHFMNFAIFKIGMLLFAYLMGSIPFGYILTKKYTGKNILEHGSGNIGSTNVGRIAGKKIALVVQILDMLKGFIPVLLVFPFGYYEFGGSADLSFAFLVATAAILGHNFSIFLKFNGGKGVNTTLGALILFDPPAVFASVAVYYLSKYISKYVSLSSILLALSLPLFHALFGTSIIEFFYFLAIGLFVVVRHIPNIKRLLVGTEPKQN